MRFIVSRITYSLARLLHAIPGERYFKEFRLLPVFFVGGAFVELMMIKWQPNGVNFYSVYKKKRIAEIIEEKLKEANTDQPVA